MLRWSAMLFVKIVIYNVIVFRKAVLNVIHLLCCYFIMGNFTFSSVVTIVCVLD